MQISRTVALTAVALGPVACGGSTDPSSRYTGPLAGQLIVTTTMTGANVASTCAATSAISGTLTLTIEEISAGAVTGRFLVTAPATETANGGPLCTNPVHGTQGINQGGPLTGTLASLSFTAHTSETGTSTEGNGSQSTVTVLHTWSFAGALVNGVITGVMTYSESSQGSAPATTFTGSGATTFAVTLR